MPWECADSTLDTSMCRSTEYPYAENQIILNIWIHLMFWSCILYYYYIHFIQQHDNTKNKAHSHRKLSHLDAITETLPLHSTKFNALSTPWSRNCNVCRTWSQPSRIQNQPTRKSRLTKIFGALALKHTRRSEFLFKPYPNISFENAKVMENITKKTNRPTISQEIKFVHWTHREEA